MGATNESRQRMPRTSYECRESRQGNGRINMRIFATFPYYSPESIVPKGHRMRAGNITN